MLYMRYFLMLKFKFRKFTMLKMKAEIEYLFRKFFFIIVLTLV